jgi:hypothetical protein
MPVDITRRRVHSWTMQGPPYSGDQPESEKLPAAWSSEAEPRENDDEGSVFLGTLLGLVGGLAVLALFYRGSLRDTRRGILIGFGLQVLIITLLVVIFGDRLPKL